MVQFLDTKFGPYQLEAAACICFHVFLLTTSINTWVISRTLITSVYYFNKYK
jgi:hypothetical protein